MTSLQLSLDRALNHPNTVSRAWLETHRSDMFRLRASNDESALYWVDEHNEKLSLAFPAVLNLDKTYVHNEGYDIVRDVQVIYFLFPCISLSFF